MDITFSIMFVALLVISCIHVSHSQTGFDNLDPNGPFASVPSIPVEQGSNQQQPADDLASTTTTASPLYQSCINGCRTITNYNPVCGSDGVTYQNVYRLNCATQCGRPVSMVRMGTCVGL